MRHRYNPYEFEEFSDDNIIEYSTRQYMDYFSTLISYNVYTIDYLLEAFPEMQKYSLIPNITMFNIYSGFILTSKYMNRISFNPNIERIKENSLSNKSSLCITTTEDHHSRFSIEHHCIMTEIKKLEKKTNISELLNKKWDGLKDISDIENYFTDEARRILSYLEFLEILYKETTHESIISSNLLIEHGIVFDKGGIIRHSIVKDHTFLLLYLRYFNMNIEEFVEMLKETTGKSKFSISNSGSMELITHYVYKINKLPESLNSDFYEKYPFNKDEVVHLTLFPNDK